MSSWFDDDIDTSDMQKRDINEEVWADTILVLAPRTLLWSYLNKQDLTQDYIKVTLEDLYNARYKFISCGYPCVLVTVEKNELINWLDSMRPEITRDADGWIVDVNKLSDIDSLKDDEIAFLKFNEQTTRDYLIFCHLGVNFNKMSRERKLNYGANPGWFDYDEAPKVSSNEIKQKIRTWKHIPNRYQDK